VTRADLELKLSIYHEPDGDIWFASELIRDLRRVLDDPSALAA